MDGMSMSTATPTPTEIMATSAMQSTLSSMEPTSSAGMGGMSSMGSTSETYSSCKVSMLWNWETIDACFLSESWQIKSRGAFAGLCIGIVFLVILLEFLRRAAKVYDRYLLRQHMKKTSALAATVVNGSSETAHGALIAKENAATTLASAVPFRPNVFQQAVRALFHTLHFALAYWIMLLAMYYNGYIIVCIIIGAFIGFFALQWESIGPLGIEGEYGIGRDGTGCHG